jgi:hypothetical protein
VEDNEPVIPTVSSSPLFVLMYKLLCYQLWVNNNLSLLCSKIYLILLRMILSKYRWLQPKEMHQPSLHKRILIVQLQVLKDLQPNCPYMHWKVLSSVRNALDQVLNDLHL